MDKAHKPSDSVMHYRQYPVDCTKPLVAEITPLSLTLSLSLSLCACVCAWVCVCVCVCGGGGGRVKPRPRLVRNIGLASHAEQTLNYTKPTMRWGCDMSRGRYGETPPTASQDAEKHLVLPWYAIGMLGVRAVWVHSACMMTPYCRSVVVQALCYKQEGRGFETRWGEFFQCT
jgi:hypothetical protein